MFFEVLRPLKKCSSGVVRLVEGWIRRSFILRPCPKHWYLQCFRLFVQHIAQRMWNKTCCHKHPCLWRPCPKLCYLQCFRVFVQHAAQACGTRKAVTSVRAFGNHAETTWLYSVFVSLRAAGCGFRVNKLNLRNRNTINKE